MYLSIDAIDVLEKVATAFNISRSDVLDGLIIANKEQLLEAVEQKSNSLLERI